MNPKKPKVTGVPVSSPPLRIAVPDGKGGVTYEEAPVFDLRLASVDGTRRGIVPAPDPAALQSAPPPANKR